MNFLIKKQNTRKIFIVLFIIQKQAENLLIKFQGKLKFFAKLNFFRRHFKFDTLETKKIEIKNE